MTAGFLLRCEAHQRLSSAPHTGRGIINVMGRTRKPGGTTDGGEYTYGHVTSKLGAMDRYTQPVSVHLSTVSYKTVAHVGTLDHADKGTFYGVSYEGRGLSVSNCPEAWEQIARLGGNPTWDLTRHDGTPFRFMDAHATDRTGIEQYALDNGYVTEVDGWQVEWEDGDTEEINSFTFNNETDALYEAEERGTEPIPFRMFAATESLHVRTGADIGEQVYPEHLDVVWTEENTNLDGVWWEDDLDPESFSAPRGTLLSRTQSVIGATQR